MQDAALTYKFSFALENGLDDYPGWGVSGENDARVRSDRRLDRVVARQGGAGAAAGEPANGIAWIYGAGGIQYVFARDRSSMSRHTSLTSTRNAFFRCHD